METILSSTVLTVELDWTPNVLIVAKSMSEEPKQKLYKQAWVCMVCGQAWDEEKDAETCSNSHEQFKMIPRFAIGKEMPYTVRIQKLRGEEVLAEQDYIPKEG